LCCPTDADAVALIDVAADAYIDSMGYADSIAPSDVEAPVDSDLDGGVQ
jgi:hypothetical protein